MTHAYRRSFTGRDKRDLLIATARAGNVIGGGDWARDRLIPDAVRAFGAGEVLLIRAPHAVRPWQHVLEPLGGYIALAERLLNGEARQAGAFNFGPMPGNARSVQEIVDAVAELWGDGARYRIDCRDYPPETRLLSIDSTKAMTMLDWCPRLDLTTTLKMTVDWYRAHLRGADMRGVTREQVRAYMETQVRK